MADHTKWRFANTLIEMMLHQPFHKITVKDICDQCQERRQTFYYHFRDKYDLVTWIYFQDASHIIDANKEESWDIVLEKIFENMIERKTFYQNAFEENGQNALIDYLVSTTFPSTKTNLKKKCKYRIWILPLHSQLNIIPMLAPI